MIIDGKKIAQEVLARVRNTPNFERIRASRFFAAVLVGDDESSISFLGQKERIAKQLGVDFRLYRFPATATNDELRAEVGAIARHKTCGGVIVQLPLPEHLNQHYILNAIPPEKDVDVLGERALGAFYVGRSAVLPPSVGAVEEVIVNSKLKIENSAVAIVGLGLLIGRPIANWIMRRARETFLLRSTSDLATSLARADIVIAGAGKAGLITPDMLAPGACVIDFGYDGGKGDFAPPLAAPAAPPDASSKMENGKLKIVSYTPTPGGTGPILVAKLYENFYRLNGKDGQD